MTKTTNQAPGGAAFERIAHHFASDRRVSRGKMLVSQGLRVDGKFFAALADDHLLVKLPRERVSELIETGVATPFSSGGRVMSEWALITPSARRRWSALAKEAFAFVS